MSLTLFNPCEPYLFFPGGTPRCLRGRVRRPPGANRLYLYPYTSELGVKPKCNNF